MRTWVRTFPAALVAVALGLTGCGDEAVTEAGAGSRAESSTPSTQPAGRTILVTQPEPQSGGMDAIVQGVLGINSQGCVVIDDTFVMIAPYGSTVIDDGRTFELTGMGRFRVGEQVRGAGGYLENTEPDQVPDFLKHCFPQRGTANYVTIRGE